jgi:NADH-quinone oxidoreductase subunit J
MTTRPRLATGGNWLAGIAAVGLFAVLAGVFLTASFGTPAGFPTDQSIVENIGYAMFDLDSQLGIASEGFLVSFVLIAVVLDAALDGSIMLAKREQEDAAAMPDGGQRPGAGTAEDGSREDEN